MHNLRIETGCYTGRKVPVNDRMCIYCTSQAVETESHFLLECSLFIKERMDFLEKVNIYQPDTNDATNEQKFLAIISIDEKYVTDALGKFIYTCLNKRNTCTAITINKTKSEHIKQSCKLITRQIELCVSIKVSISQFHFYWLLL